MEYDVTGTLRIDTEAFEKALKEAQERIDAFRENLESLGSLGKELGFPELNKNLKDVDKTVDEVVADFEKADKSADNVTKSVKKLKKESNNAKETIKTLDEYFDQATGSAERLGAESQKNAKNIQEGREQVQSLSKDVKKTATSFSEMDRTLSSNMAKVSAKIDEVDTKLKKSYSSLHKYYEEFNALNTRMVRNEEKLSRIYSYAPLKHRYPSYRYKESLRRPEVGYNRIELERTTSNNHYRYIGKYGKTAPMYNNAYLENKDIKEGLIFNKRTLEEELKYINELETELKELKQEKDSLMSSSTGADKLVYELEAPIRKIQKLKQEMNTLFKKNISEHSTLTKTFKDVSLKDSFLADEEKMGKIKVRFKEIIEELSTARTSIKETLNRLVNDYGISMEEISSLTKGLFDPKILTEGLSEAVLGINPVLKDLEKKIAQTKNKIFKIQNDAMKKSARLTRDSVRSNISGLSDYLPRRKDGSYYNNDRVKRILEEFQEEQKYVENYKLDEFLKLRAELESLEREFEALSKERDKFFNDNSYSTSGLKNNMEVLQTNLRKTKLSLKDAIRSVRFDRETALEYKSMGNDYTYKSYMKDAENDMKRVVKLRDEYRAIKSELQGMQSQYDKLRDKQNSVWRVQELEPFIQMMTAVVNSTREATESVEKMDSEMGNLSFDEKMKAQFDGLNQMLVETGQMSVEQARMFGTEIVHSLDAVDNKVREVTKNIRGRMNIFYKNFGGKSGKWFTEQSPYGQESTRWIHEQLSTTRNFFKGFTQGFAKLKKEQSESVSWMNELQVKMNELKYGSRDFINTQSFASARSEAQKYLSTLRNVSASTNQWVNQEITDFNRFAKAVQTSSLEAENRLKRLEQTFSSMSTLGLRNDIGMGQLFSGTGRSEMSREMKRLQAMYTKTGNTTGVGFAGTKDFQNLNRQMQEYNRLSNIANLNTERMGLGFEKFGQYSKKAESSVRSLGGVLRTLRTTMSMIGGMFVWEFAFKIMDSARATISAKSEMESYYKTLNMGSMEIASFNKQLDKTVNKFQKMNKFQLGETISALGVEFKMSTDEMNQVMKVAPMIVNEYLRAGRSTEEAILAIKDISQGEFLRLSRETGVGKKEIQDAGWSGDNKDIISLYEALEKIGKSRHWDVFAMKAQSLNDVMLITENRMTEFATLVSDAVTPIIVNSFNALGDAFNSASRWYEGLSVSDKIWVQIGTLATVGLTTAGVFNNHLLPAMQNFGANLVSSFLGVDSAIVKEKGLAQAIAHETAVERIANIERTNGREVLHAKIMTLKEEELATKLGMNTTKLKTRYDKLQNQALRLNSKELKTNTMQEKISMLVDKEGLTTEQARTRVIKARTLAQRSLILAEEQGITTGQAMKILMEEEALAEMGTFKALMVRKLGLDANIVREKGMITALATRITTSGGFIGTLVAETMATLGLESATATLIITLGLVVAPLLAIGLAVAPLIQQFAELQGSYEKVTDVLQAGTERIDALKEKQKSLQDTVDELSGKTNRSIDEEKKLNRTRRQLANTTDALKLAEEELAYAKKVDNAYTEWSDQADANKYRNAKKINKEYQKLSGTTEDVTDATYGMGSAYEDMKNHLQIVNYMENHRVDRFKELAKDIDDTTSSQEEYNQKLKEFGKDWNQAYDDMEIAQQKMADPNNDAFGRIFASMEYGLADAKMDWIEFWADPWEGIKDVKLPFIYTDLDTLSKTFDDIKGSYDDFTGWLDTTGADLQKKWDDFWKPVTDFFNGLTVDSSFDPFAGIKEAWGDANDWLSSLLPDISVDGIKEWFGKNVREPLQREISNFLKNPFGGGNSNEQNKQTQQPSAKKSFDLKSLFNFDYSGFKTSLGNGIRTAMNGVSPIIQGAGAVWKRLTSNNGKGVVDSAKQSLANVKSAVSQRFDEGKQTITSFASSWGRSAHSTGSTIYSNLKGGIGDIIGMIRNKFSGITGVIDGIKASVSKSVKGLADALTAPLQGIHLDNFGYFGSVSVSGSPRHSKGGKHIRIRRPVYGSGDASNMSFETALKGMLTAQGFRRPSSYQFYPNSRKTTGEAWADGTANCFDGAKLIVALGQLFGLKGHIVTGDWNGLGHAGAVVGGKLYDMTQFQRRGVFRGTSGVHFGSRGGSKYGVGRQENNKTVNINITNDLSNARIYGIDDLDNHIKETTERTFYEMHSQDGALGY